MVVFEKGITLRQKLGEYDKESLKEYGTTLGLSGLSSLKKADLIDKVAQKLLDPEVLFDRMAILTDEEIALMKKGVDGIYQLQDEDWDDADMLNELDLVIISKGEMLTVADMYEAYQSFDADQFEEYREKASWVRKCLFFAEELYVFTPNDVMLDLVNCKVGLHLKQEELADIIKRYPKDECNSIPFNKFFLNKLYMEKERIPELDQLQRVQTEKDFYFPSESEIVEFYNTGALISEKAYQNLQKYIQNEFEMEEQKASELMVQLWQKESMGSDLHDATRWFWSQVPLKNEKQKQKIAELFMHIADSTRTRVNRGYKPIELLTQGGFLGDMSVNGAGSLNPVNIPPMEGIKGGKNGTVYAEKKIYPNAPCPCGSGKKYKKCCGLNS